ncbi:MAG: hypothetical protein JRN15_09190 [Nitrososphaerota archaeon]|nr:hypothetical protein [Nitrososphaerota archaeon]
MVKTDPPNEDEVKRAADVREWLEERIAELESELTHLKDMQTVVDSVLRKTSFIPAAELRKSAPVETKKPQPPPQPVATAGEESRPLRRSKDGMLIANAVVTQDRIVIVPSSDVKVSQTIPPFQTFFVNRILKGYEAKDKELAQAGKLPNNQILTYKVDEMDGNIGKVTITNYREKARLNEILSTVNWALARMLEKK